MPSLKRRSCLHHIYGNLTSFGDMYDSCLVSNDLDNCVEWAMFSQVDIPSLLLQSGLIDIQMEGYSFTWAHPSASKMSKLDRFLLSNGLLSFFPHLSAVCLDRHLSDHRPILLKEVHSDFGPTPFCFFHSWLDLPGFDEMISSSWASFNLDDSNAMIRFKKKLKLLKVEIRKWTKDFKEKQEGQSRDLNLKLRDIDKTLDQGGLR
ncbi:RNA-directed DNA polymerase, eukaryota [Tanacetum coccineum]